jgi:hypothetical protein
LRVSRENTLAAKQASAARRARSEYSRCVSAEQLVTQIVVGLVLQIVVTLALSAWGGWVARRRGGGRAWAWAPRAPWISFALLAIGLSITLPMLLRTFDQIARVDAGSRARALSEGISRAMTVSALFIVPGYLVLAVFVIACIIGSLRAPAGQQEPQR